MMQRVRRADLPSSLFVSALVAGILAFSIGMLASPASAQHGGGHSGGFGGGHAGRGMSSGHAAPAVSAPHAAPFHPAAPPPTASNSGSNVARQQSPSRPLILSNTLPALNAEAGAESNSGPTREVIGFPRSSQRWANVDPQQAGPGWRTITPTNKPSSGWTYSPVQGGARAPIRISGQGHELWLSEPNTNARGFVDGVPLSNSPQPPHKIPPRNGFFPPFNGGFAPGFFPGIGFGFGPFAGFGLGFSEFGCDPFWGFGCDAFGYDSYYLPYYEFGALPAPSEPNPTEEQPAPSSSYTIPYTYEPPPGPQEPSNQSNETVLFLANGQVHLITSYWLANGQLHYETGDGVENIVDLSQVDLQSTVNANAARGITFTLRPSPETPPDQDQNQIAPPAPPGASSPNPQR
jgi:hypothetical protein